MEILVSVAMSVYNGESCVKETIDSILDQSFKDFEFIIIDDASIDNTYRILKEYQQKDSRIVLLKNDQNLGLTKSLNKAINHARGEYIARIDAGAIALPQRLVKQVEYMESHPDIGLLGSSCKFSYQMSSAEVVISNPTDHQQILKAIRKKNPFVHSSVMFSRDLFMELGGYDESFEVSQDHELWTRMVCRSKAANISEILVIKPFYSYSTSVRRNSKQLRANIRILLRKIRLRISPWYFAIYFSKYIFMLLIPNRIRWRLRVIYRTFRWQKH